MDVNDFNEVRDCIYKDEHYSVRDNGAVMRHPREGNARERMIIFGVSENLMRKLDIWKLAGNEYIE